MWRTVSLEPVALALELAQKSGLRLTLFPSHLWGHWKSGTSVPISYVTGDCSRERALAVLLGMEETAGAYSRRLHLSLFPLLPLSHVEQVLSWSC